MEEEYQKREEMLREEIPRPYSSFINELEEENKELEERIRFLEQCLDNKEKVDKQLRKDIKWYEKEEDRLREENKRLSDFLECEA